MRNMKIALTSAGPTIDDEVDSHFGRCPYFLIIEPETMEIEPIQNPNISLGGGAGPQSAQLMASKGVSIVLTGNCGPKAHRTFGAAGIQVITGVTGRVRESVEQFRDMKNK
jgi:predicted Fe-Mo cluster-binding NifX family protein